MASALTAMILAAGRGERMRPLTDECPKPLIIVGGKPLIVHHIEKLVAIGVERIVINASYLAELLMCALGDGKRFGCDIVYSVEADALESGGGVAEASRHFTGAAIIVVSADIFSHFDYARLLKPLQAVGRGDIDAHFVMVRPVPGEPGAEFALAADGRLHRGAPALTLASIGVLSTAFCQSLPRSQRFRLLPHYEALVAAGRVTGQRCDALWRNVTTAHDVERLNASDATNF
jgi:N-acetyl-alpha-D-muramate 1-phosphate uridylyltransferase